VLSGQVELLADLRTSDGIAEHARQ
jgi:hypothetical protein